MLLRVVLCLERSFTIWFHTYEPMTISSLSASSVFVHLQIYQLPNEEYSYEYLYRGTALLWGVFLFFLVEKILRLRFNVDQVNTCDWRSSPFLNRSNVWSSRCHHLPQLIRKHHWPTVPGYGWRNHRQRSVSCSDLESGLSRRNSFQNGKHSDEPKPLLVSCRFDSDGDPLHYTSEKHLSFRWKAMGQKWHPLTKISHFDPTWSMTYRMICSTVVVSRRPLPMIIWVVSFSGWWSSPKDFVDTHVCDSRLNCSFLSSFESLFRTSILRRSKSILRFAFLFHRLSPARLHHRWSIGGTSSTIRY